MADKLGTLFERFLNEQSLFQDRGVLYANHLPEEILHREEQIEQIGKILAPCLRLQKPSNLFLYGKTGTGKTLTIRHIAKKLEGVAKERDIHLKILYLNCKLKNVADTEYRIVAQMIKELGRDIPPTGLPTEEVYHIFFDLVDREKQLCILILDEIDEMVKKIGDGFLYTLTRMNAELKQAQVTLVGVSNNLLFADALDSRVKSSLSEEEMLFPAYNALQIQDILKDRTTKAFRSNVVKEGVIEKCAARSAKEHGDARRALELLRISGEIAEREGSKYVLLSHIDLAEEKLEKDRILDAALNQPKQLQAVLLAILLAAREQKRRLFTGEVYVYYQQLCRQTGMRPLTQRRISDILGELDLLGIINAKVISKGRYGRMREIHLNIPDTVRQNLFRALQTEFSLR
ncbi:orc1/cdc6 family replication initiation protein [Candidatus Woesearchaeota archaeon]|nr:orc1/cdc6 family replication initiation protein [Candidatus Woesearchaeota archaeon]